MRVAIAGLGSIGREIAMGLDKGIPGMQLVAAAQRDSQRIDAWMGNLKHPLQLLEMEQLHEVADIVIECAGGAVLKKIAPAVLKAGKKLLVLSSGALLHAPELLSLADQHRGQLIIPSGAIGGLDIIAAMAEGGIQTVKLITTKPPSALQGHAYLGLHCIEPGQLTAPVRIFSGSALEAARHFPDNLNVAASLSLAGVGAHRTEVELWLDPAATVNRHEVSVLSGSAAMTIQIAARPSVNPKTSTLAAQSALSVLRRMSAALRFG